jgi:hypothetical protein
VTEGGASGAFFFFSKDELFIAKSCTEDELTALTSCAKQYADYLESPEGRGSYISKVIMHASFTSCSLMDSVRVT